MKSFNFQIVNVANLAAITTPFPDHICYFTEDLENYYIWENNALKEIFVDASSITWNNITNKPTTITGFGITDAVKVNNGNLNYLAKFTPDGQTIGNSQIRDDGTSVGIFIAPEPNWRLYVNGGTLKGGSFSTTRISTNVDLAIGAYGSSSGASSQGMNIGVFGQAGSNTLLNIGVFGAATGVVAGVNIGMYAESSGGTSGNYSVQLKDGTETVTGRYLRNMTTDGKANWAKINITEVTNGLSSTLLGAPNGIATLDSNSKLTIAQMPISVMDYKGTYDIVTNTPNLVDGTGNQGDVYVCTTSGTRTFGPGNTITVGVGDWLIYNGTKWEKTLGNNVGSGTVNSVGITLGTTGNDVTVSNSPITTSGNINLNIPSASASARGLLTASHWSLFNDKIGGLGLNNYVAKYTPDGKTIAASRLYEDTNSFSIGIGASALANTAFYVQGIAGQTTGGDFQNHTGGTSNGYGLIGTSNQTAGVNIGVAARALGTGAATNIGIKAEASSATNNYSIQLVDGTQTTVGRYLRNMTTDGKANWANIQVSEVTGAVAGAPNGTPDYVARWTPDDKTIGIGTIRDNGNRIGINAPPDSSVTAYLISNSTSGLFISSSIVPGTISKNGISVNVSGAVSDNKGIDVTVSGGTTSSIGINTVATAAAGTTAWGGIFAAQGAGTKYAVRLKDGTQLPNKFLKSITNDGDANWSYLPDSAQIMCSDMVSSITADATNPKAYWAAPCDGQLTDAFASLRLFQVGGATFTVLVKSSGVTLATLTFPGSSGYMSTNPAATQIFSKGNIFEFYVSQVGDGTAKGLIVTMNYLRT